MANVTRWDPVGDMMSLRQAMDRLVEDSYVSPAAWRGHSEQFSAPLDVHETADELVVTASLPGVAPDDVEITISGQTLTIRGEVKPDEGVERNQYLYRERRYGPFNRQLELPMRVEGDRAEASFENGLLRLTIPKAEEVRPRQIRINAGSNGNRAR